MATSGERLEKVCGELPVVFSMGDPHGIGPEVVLKSLAEPEVGRPRPSIIFGCSRYLHSLADDLRLSVPFDHVQVIDVVDLDYPPKWGTVAREAGGAALECLAAACSHCRQERLPLLVTAPIHKRAAVSAGMATPGQTEFVASFFPGFDPAMAFFSDSFHLLLVTVHIALREVFDRLSTTMIVTKSLLFFDALRSLGTAQPRIAVCGLNPHASESGLFGSEEFEIIKPALHALESTCGSGVFYGPLPADTVFRQAVERCFDGVVALYHDQGLAPLKAVAFKSAVNATLGLPMVRTSPAHGTAFEIAGQGRADATSMKSAILWGCRLAKVCRMGQEDLSQKA